MCDNDFSSNLEAEYAVGGARVVVGALLADGYFGVVHAGRWGSRHVVLKTPKHNTANVEQDLKVPRERSFRFCV